MCLFTCAGGWSRAGWFLLAIAPLCCCWSKAAWLTWRALYPCPACRSDPNDPEYIARKNGEEQDGKLRKVAVNVLKKGYSVVTRSKRKLPAQEGAQGQEAELSQANAGAREAQEATEEFGQGRALQAGR